MTAVHGTVLYVDDDAPPAGDGLTWPTACRFLQDAMTVAAASGGAVTEIRIAEGTYTPDRDEMNSHGTGNRAATFQLINGVALRGGYAGLSNPGNPDQRDVDFYETILSGDLAGNDGPGLFDNNDENSLHVTTGSGTNATAVIDGFTVTAGNANGPGWPQLGSDGGGMLNDTGGPTVNQCRLEANRSKEAGAGMSNLFGSNPTITGCVFLNNAVDQSAFPRTSGGMYNGGSSPTVTGCRFEGNSAGDGGGMGNEQSGPTITGCQFIDNSAGVNHGGAMINVGSSPRITNCEFTGNSATLYGGAIRNSSHSNTTVTACTFDSNTAQWGAGIGSYQSTDTVDACTFAGNSAQHGGGMAFQEATPTIVGCLVVDNAALDYGGGLATWTAGHPTVINSTFSNNTGGIGGGMYNHEANGVTLRNCLVWENDGTEIAGALALVTYSDIQGGYPGSGNTDTDPLFADPGNGDYHVTAGSPCIDAADNSAVPPGQDTDLDGNPRFVDDTCKADTGSPPDDAPYVDMGAYEFQGCSCDLNGDGSVGVNDFLILLGAWGPCGDCANCPADFDGDCIVGVTDFLILLANWGSCL
ncbi:MAG: hypothetical protein ACYSU7_00935 [Planctomycetota bacterium]